MCTLLAPREQEALQRGDGDEAQSRDQDRRLYNTRVFEVPGASKHTGPFIPHIYSPF